MLGQPACDAPGRRYPKQPGQQIKQQIQHPVPPGYPISQPQRQADIDQEGRHYQNRNQKMPPTSHLHPPKKLYQRRD